MRRALTASKVKRAVDEDRGWLRLGDAIPNVVTGLDEGSREMMALRLQQRRTEELKKWGYTEGDPPDALAVAEASVEAASPLDRVVPLSSLAYRRFRTEVMEPLLAVPKAKAKSRSKRGRRTAANGNTPQGPKGRLARSVKALLEEQGGDREEQRRIVEGISLCLQSVGVRPDHLLRIKMSKHLTITVDPQA